jgi:hypothetical protein
VTGPAINAQGQNCLYQGGCTKVVMINLTLVAL